MSQLADPPFPESSLLCLLCHSLVEGERQSPGRVPRHRDAAAPWLPLPSPAMPLRDEAASGGIGWRRRRESLWVESGWKSRRAVGLPVIHSAASAFASA